MEELIIRYKNLSLKKRLGLCIVLACIYPVMTFIEQFDDLQVELDDSISRLASAKTSLEIEQKKLKSLPNLEDRAAEVNAKLSGARKYLPAEIKFDDILNRFGKLEKRFGVKMTSFEPKGETQGQSTVRYAEVHLDIQLEGRYGGIMLFLDHIVHLKALVHLKSLEFSVPKLTASKRSGSESQEIDPLNNEQTIMLAAKLVFYKSLGV